MPSRCALPLTKRRMARARGIHHAARPAGLAAPSLPTRRAAVAMTIAAIVTALAWLGRATDVHAASAHRIADDPGPPRLPVASGFDDAVSTATLNSPTSSTSSISSNA